MSIKSMIKKAGMYGTIKYQTSSIVDGAQLTKTWSIRHANVPMRVNIFPKKKEFQLYGGQTVMAEAVIYLETKSDIENRDIIELGGNTYEIKYIADWDSQGEFQSIYVERYINE